MFAVAYFSKTLYESLNMTGTTDRDYLKTNEFLPHPRATVAYLVLFTTYRDNLPVKAFTRFTEALGFITSNPPHHPFDPRDKGKPVPQETRDAFVLYGFDDPYHKSDVYGYDMWTLVDGVPTSVVRFYWPEDESDKNWWPEADADRDIE